jgi:hypothetical protein
MGFKEFLDELFAQGLGLLSAEGRIALQRVMHDGTKGFNLCRLPISIRVLPAPMARTAP